jgi:hypothetical protein
MSAVTSVCFSGTGTVSVSPGSVATSAPEPGTSSASLSPIASPREMIHSSSPGVMASGTRPRPKW